ncbi:MAG: YidC/Oxa1 family membrane protein insertase [Gammaproteobacteria bacterium]
MDIAYTLFIFPLEYSMGLCFERAYQLTGSYGASVVILSLVVNVAMLPLYYLAEKWKLQENTIRRKMEPELASIRKYSEGREKYYYTQEVYRRFGYHPISAIKVSFGFLIQIPFFFAAYQLLSHFPAWEGVGFLSLRDLSAPDGLLHHGDVSLNLLPFVMTAINLVSAYAYTAYTGNFERAQLWLLALFFLVVLYASPSGLVLYWTINNVFSLAKNVVGQTMKLDFLTLRESDDGSREIGASGIVSVRLGQCLDRVSSLVELPALFAAIVFLTTVCGVSIYVLSEHGPATNAAMDLSIGLLVYLCLAPFLRSNRGVRGTLRQKLYITLVRLLFAVLVVFVVVWLRDADLFGLSLDRKHIWLVLLVLLICLYAPTICERIEMLGVPYSHWLYAVTSTLSAFALCMANPLSLYASSDDFHGSPLALIGELLVNFAIVLCVAAILYIVVDEKARKALTLLSVFCSCAVIVYSNMHGGIGLMDHFILNNPDSLRLTVNGLLAEIAVLTALFAVIAYVTIQHRRVVTYVAVAVLATSVLAAANDTYGVKQRDNQAADRELPEDHSDITGFSRDKNVLIVMLDGFPGAYVSRVKEEAPGVLKEYSGFVWYPNVLTTHAGTWGAAAALAGGRRYTVQEINGRNGQSLAHAMREAYSVYPAAFIPNGYDVTYVQPQYSGGCNAIDERVHCAETTPYGPYYHDKYEDSPLYDVKTNEPIMLTLISLFKASPFFLKSRIYDSGNWHGVNDIKAAAYRYKLNEWGFLRVLAREGNTNIEPRTLKFIQLQIPHAPNALNDSCELEPQKATYFAEAVCTLREIGALLAWMKDNGVYHNTKIVLVSDHGWWVDNSMFSREFAKTIPEGPERRAAAGFVQPLLLIKDFEARGNVARSDTFLSNSDVPAIVCSTVGGCGDLRTDPIRNVARDRTLVFNITAQPADVDKSNKFEVQRRYEVKENIFDARNWKRIK